MEEYTALEVIFCLQIVIGIALGIAMGAEMIKYDVIAPVGYGWYIPSGSVYLGHLALSIVTFPIFAAQCVSSYMLAAPVWAIRRLKNVVVIRRR